VKTSLVHRGFAIISLCAFILSVALAPASASEGAHVGKYIVVMKNSVNDPAIVAADQARKYGAHVRFVYRHALKGYAASIPIQRLAEIRANNTVAYIAEDQSFSGFTACPICSIPQITARGVRRIAGDKSSTKSGDGKGSVNINIAIIDSGIQPDQPDLNVVGGVNCSTGTSFADQEGHGTIVAGVAAAKDNKFGIVGIAPGAPLWAVRVLDENNLGTTSTVLCGVDWVTATRTDSDPTNDILVANMSLGEVENGRADDGQCGITGHDLLHQAICRSTAAGVTYVVSAGNDAIDLAQARPATYGEVLTMTAIADSDGAPGALGGPDPCEGYPDDSAAPFSNFATLRVDQAHTLAAPGVCIASTYFGSDVAVDSGTSYASPFGTGMVALCIARGACAGLTPAQIVSKIVKDAADYNTKHTDYGFVGDPRHPGTGRYYGDLIRAALY
jgi:subtilisin family serine protease